MAEREPGRGVRLGRRELLLLGAGGTVAGGAGLALGFVGARKLQKAPAYRVEGAEGFRPSVFLALSEGGEVTVWVSRSEMGQGVSTALPLIVAEELDADWRDVSIAQAPTDEAFGWQTTVASASVSHLYEVLRRAGATARAMLVQAGATAFGVPLETCATEAGFVVHRPSGRALPYGALSAAAATLEVPEEVPLKDPASFRLIGRPTPRLDAAAKASGQAVYGVDVRLPGMRFASIERAPRYGATLEGFDETAARAVPGVLDVRRVPAGVAVVAETTWSAFEGRAKLAAQWSAGPHAALDDAAVLDALRGAGEGAEARREGDPAAELAREGVTRVEATFEVPYLAHACMEPINATAQVSEGRCEVWAPTQNPEGAREKAAELTGLPLEACAVHVTLLGGGFGRRGHTQEVEEVVALAAEFAPAPVQLVWSREDTIRHGRFRNAARHRIEAGLEDGRPVAWRDVLASPSLAARPPGEVDTMCLEGALEPPYALGAIEVRHAIVDLPIPVHIWRSVSHSYDAFAVEGMIDALAEAAGATPLAFRRTLLPEGSEQRAVLDRAAALAEAAPLLPGRARGLAVHGCYGSHCAQVAEVSLADGRPQVHRVWAAVACGRVINPLGVEAQIEGAIVYALSAALRGRVDVAEGAVRQSNFHDYPLLRFPEAPEIEVALLELDRHPSGVGEVGVPPLAPAVASALFALTGERWRRLPFASRG